MLNKSARWLLTSFMAFSKKKQSEISLWLRDEGFSEAIVEAFEENEVDGEGFMLLTDDDICQMVKPLGTRRKLICIRNALNGLVSSDLQPLEDYDNSGSALRQPNDGCGDGCASGRLEESQDDHDIDDGVHFDDEVSPSVSRAVSEVGKVRQESNGFPKEPKADVKQEGPFHHLKKKAAAKAAAECCKPLPMPFDLPANYPQDVMEGLKKELLHGRPFSKFILCISSAIFRYTAYPTTPEYEHVAQQIVDNYPFLAGKRKDTDYLVTALRDKMKYLRNVKPRPQGPKRETTDSDAGPPDKKQYKGNYQELERELPKATKGTVKSIIATKKVNLDPEIPAGGEDKVSHDRHVKLMQLEERKVSPDVNILADLMKRTFPIRRAEIIDEPQPVNELLKVYPSLRRCDQLLAELERIVGKSVQELRAIWLNTIPKVFLIAENESNESIQKLLDRATSGCSDASKSLLAMMILCYLLPDTRTTVDTSRIVIFIPEFADVTKEASKVASPQPIVMVRGNLEASKEAFLVCEKTIMSLIPVEDAPIVIFAAYYAFNMQYCYGCTNLFCLLEILLLNATPPKKRSRLVSIVHMLENKP